MKPKELIKILTQFNQDEDITIYNTSESQSNVSNGRLVYGDNDNLEISQKTQGYPILPYCKFFFPDLHETKHFFKREADMHKLEEVFVWFTPKKTYFRIGYLLYVSNTRDIPATAEFIKGIL
jgi:hypothetical protein